MNRQEATIKLVWRTTMDLDMPEEIEMVMKDLAADVGMLAGDLQDAEVMIDNRMMITMEVGPHPVGKDDEVPRNMDDLKEKLEEVQMEIVEDFANGTKMARGKHRPKEPSKPPEGVSEYRMEMLEQFVNIQKNKFDSGLLSDDEHQRGIYNGAEHILAVMQNRAPQLRMPDGTYSNGRQWDGEFD